MITTEAAARERVRIMLDRADAPYLSDNEINAYLEMAMGEYIRERVGKYDATQKLRDDLGEYIKSRVYVSEEAKDIIFGEENTIDLYSDGDGLGHVSTYDKFSFIDHGNTGAYLGEYGLNINKTDGTIGYVLGIDVRYINNIQAPDDDYKFDISPTDTTSYTTFNTCKIISIDEYTSIANDPFNMPEEGHPVAVRVGDIYHISGNNKNDVFESEEKRDGTGILTAQYCFILNYISGQLAPNYMVAWLPFHGKEEVCKIAVRKILGVTADDRYVSQQVEIQQSEKK